MAATEQSFLDAPTEIALSGVVARILRADQGVVVAAVLLPETVDGKGTSYGHKDVRRAMGTFLGGPRQIGVEHTGKPLPDTAVQHLFSYITEQDQEIEGTFLPAGTWVMGVLVLDPDLWRQVDAGELNGFSVQGTARVTTEATRHRFSTTQVNLPGRLAQRVLELGRTMVPSDLLVEDGLDPEPHVTVLYGLHGSDPAPVEDLVRGARPFPAELGQTSIFSNPKFDVVKLEVHSEGLHDLHGRIRSLPNSSAWPEYTPHVTLAYVSPGTGERFAHRADLEGVTFEIDSIVFSDRNRNQTYLPLQFTDAYYQPGFPSGR